ncbi:hypothetical protein J2793_000365 [Paraburkholderia caledonica]|uniref:Uncharacterized protein n=1 Tax=Paraburkholderia caledonica TaxID=134536 RepID=A0AB73I4M1_9BURK|nr:hypothetical protein [Paraburkholderia caledonica]
MVPVWYSGNPAKFLNRVDEAAQLIAMRVSVPKGD